MSKRTLPLGRRAWAFVSGLGDRPLPLGARTLYRWRAGWFDLSWRLQRAGARALLAGQLPPLVLVLGMWRSGTTVLHDLLSLEPGLLTPRTWQCMRPESFATAGAPKEDVRMARPMDQLEIRLLGPQEDEFALLALGGPSVYGCFVNPAGLGAVHGLLAQEHWLALDERDWLEPWREFLLLVVAGQPAQGLLLKSPNHSFRIRALLRRFPDAKLIWLCRDPADVQASNRKMWSAMFAEYGRSEPAPGALDAFLLEAQQQAGNTVEALSAELSVDQLAVVRYEDLAANPADVLARLCARLSLPPPPGAEVVAYLEAHRAVRPQRYGQVETPSALTVVRDAHARALFNRGL